MSDFSNLSDDELIQLLSGLDTGGGLPGKTPAARLNYYQDLVSTLGFDPVQQAGLDDTAPDEEEYTPPVNKQRYVYESDPQYKKIFDLIDAGASPATAVKESGITDDAQSKEAQKVAIDYAGSKVDEMNAKSAFDKKAAKTKASYTAADGSKYKNAPLGGNDIYGSASEFDLLGQPSVEGLMQSLAASRSGLAPHAQFVDAGPQRRSAPATYTTPGVKAGQSVTKQMGEVTPQVKYEDGSVSGFSATPDELAYAQQLHKNAPTYTTKATAAVQPTSNSGNGPERSWDAPSLKATGRTLYGDGTSSNDTAAYRAAVRQRIGKSKATQVRSDASTNALRRVLALRAVLAS